MKYLGFLIVFLLAGFCQPAIYRSATQVLEDPVKIAEDFLHRLIGSAISSKWNLISSLIRDSFIHNGCLKTYTKTDLLDYLHLGQTICCLTTKVLEAKHSVYGKVLNFIVEMKEVERKRPFGVFVRLEHNDTVEGSWVLTGADRGKCYQED